MDKDVQKYMMEEIKKILDRPKKSDPEFEKKKARLLKEREEAREKKKGTEYDHMPPEMEKAQREKFIKYGHQIPPPEEL